METLNTPENEKINGDNPFIPVAEVSLGKNALIYGAILGGVQVLYGIIIWLLGQTLNKSLGYIAFIFVIGIMFYGTKEYRDKYLGGYMEYGKAFTSNFLIGFYACIISAVYAYFLYKFIDPSLINTILDTTRETMEKNPGLSPEQVEKAMDTTSKFMTPLGVTFFAAVFGALGAAILGLIVSIFHKKEKPLL